MLPHNLISHSQLLPNSNEDEDIVESAYESESKTDKIEQARVLTTSLESESDEEVKGMIDQSDEEAEQK